MPTDPTESKPSSLSGSFTPPPPGEPPPFLSPVNCFKVVSTLACEKVDVEWTTYADLKKCRKKCWFIALIRNDSGGPIALKLHEIGAQARGERVIVRIWPDGNGYLHPLGTGDGTLPAGFVALEDHSDVPCYTLNFSGPVCLIEGYHELHCPYPTAKPLKKKKGRPIGGGDPGAGYPPPGAPCDDE